MRRRLLCAAVAFAACCPWQAAAADLASAKALYVAASYEEALAMLATLDGAAADEIHQMRALCLFALGRQPAAEAAIEQMVISNPVRTVSANDASPKFVELFTEVRRRALPAAARAAYTKAKSQYDAKRWPEAVASFSSLIRLLGEPGVAAVADLADFRQLGEGFLRLSESEAAAAEAARAAAVPPPAPAAAPSPSAVTPAERLVYAAGDAGVVPPVELRRTMPAWAPTNPALRFFSATGAIEIVIDESGAVEQARMLKRTQAAYDDALLRAARAWQYTPARKGTQPVRYRHVLEVTVRPPN